MGEETENAPKAKVEDSALARQPKTIEGKFRKTELALPEVINSCPGISLYGHTIRSIIFSTDIAIIRNCDADAVLAVYPFTCQPTITQALLLYSERPVFTGVSGAVTTGMRSVELAMQSEMQGATGVVANLATPVTVIEGIARSVDIPVVATIADLDEYAIAKIEAGARIVNVAGGKNTADVVRRVRDAYPYMPIIASGGKTEQSIADTIAAGADAISWTPPSLQELERLSMEKNKKVYEVRAKEAVEKESRERRDARLLKAVNVAAEEMSSLDEEQRQEYLDARARDAESFLLERLDIQDRMKLRELLMKLFDVVKPEDEEGQRALEGPQGEGADEASDENA